MLTALSASATDVALWTSSANVDFDDFALYTGTAEIVYTRCRPCNATVPPAINSIGWCQVRRVGRCVVRASAADRRAQVRRRAVVCVGVCVGRVALNETRCSAASTTAKADKRSACCRRW